MAKEKITKEQIEEIKERLKQINAMNEEDGTDIRYYTDFKEVGSGMMGHVFDVEGPHLKVKAVMKVVSLKDYFEKNRTHRIEEINSIRESTLTEMEILKKFKECPYVTDYIDGYIFDDSVYITIMKKYTCFDDYMINQTITEADVILLAKDVLKALIAVGDSKIGHRDVKPENIYIDYLENGEKRFVLGDFGAATVLPNKEKMLTIIGSKAFIAPEIRYAKPVSYSTYNADVYSLGSVIYYILSGGNIPNNYIKKGGPPKLVKNSEDLSKIVLKAVEFESKNRYKTANEMLEDLNKLDILDHTQNIINMNSYVALAKKLINKGDIVNAMEILKKGIYGSDGKDIACKRIYYYLKLRQDKFSTKDCHELKYIADVENDASAQCIWGAYLFSKGMRTESKKYLKVAALNGNVIAKHLYGRMLCSEGNYSEGLKICERAAYEGLIPAVCFLKKMKDKRIDYTPSKEFNTFIEKVDVESYEADRTAFYVEFL